MSWGRLRTLVLVGLAASAVAGCGSGSTSSPALPQHVQSVIAGGHPILAYVPKRLPPGYRYSGHFSSGPNEFGLLFSKAGETPDQLGYEVRKSHCPGGAVHTFIVDGIPVSWSGTYEDQRAWRCLTRSHVPLVISASRSIAGDSALDTPRRRSDALLLARLVASAERIH